MQSIIIKAFKLKNEDLQNGAKKAKPIIRKPLTRRVEGEPRGAGTRKAPLRIDTSAAASANSRVQVTLIDIRTSLPVHLSVPPGAGTLIQVTHPTRTTPGQANRATALGL